MRFLPPNTFLLLAALFWGLGFKSEAATYLGNERYISNGVIVVGVDLNVGGSITWLSLAGSTNIINNSDLGREIQQSYYSGPTPYNPSNNMNTNAYPNWPWNPIQSGDISGKNSTILASSNTSQSIYVKCQPMQWALTNVPGQCTFESWITFGSSNVVVVSNRLTNLRTDTAQQFFSASSQELPAVYTIYSLRNLYSYISNAPFTGDAFTKLPSAPPASGWTNWIASESWAALVNNSSWGLGIYLPGAADFIGGVSSGTDGPQGTGCGYAAPLWKEILDTNITYTYTYYLILGSLTQIRDFVYAQPWRPGCNFVFQSDRQHWYYNTNDAGWPINGSLAFNLNRSDPQMLSSYTAFPATNASKIYICAAYHLTQTNNQTAQLFWATNKNIWPDSGISAANSLSFPIIADGQFHTYQVNLAATNAYQGLITRLRFDPIGGGQAGDYVELASISTNPFAGKNTVTPQLNLILTNNRVTFGFPAIAATNAGFVSNSLVYNLESSTNLMAGNWQGVAGYTNLVGNNSTKLFTNPPSPPAGFYRVKVQLQ